mgnify:CR=1 FL=1
MVEKRTDVALGVELVRAAALKLADRLILVTNDTDQRPSIDLCAELKARVTLVYVKDPENPQYIKSLIYGTHGSLCLDEAVLSDLWRRV